MGEETFLDLIEHVALLSSGASILLLCMARPELGERRPAWPMTLRLAPLGDADVEELIPSRVSEGLRERIKSAAGGNPLFVAEMIALVRESGNGEISVPPSIQALLAARLDQLDPIERGVLERGSIEGEIFHRGAVQALAPEETQVTPRLAALVRRELIRPDKAQFPGEDAFRFRHLLLRDAAYDALPKAVRADLHERFAAWLEQRGDLVELDEILGHHLEQAARYKAELGRPDAALAERAGERLAVAGKLARWRGDNRAATALLERALELLRPIGLDVHLELHLAAAVWPDAQRAAAIATAAAERARAAGDRAGEAAARVAAAYHRSAIAADPASFDELEALAHAALPLLDEAEDHAGLVSVWVALGWAANARCRFEEQALAAEQSLRHSLLAGDPQGWLFSIAQALVYGPRAADEALATLEALLPEALHPAPLMRRVVLLAMLGRFEEAWPAAHEACERWREFTGHGGEWVLAEVASLAGDHAAAAGYLRIYCHLLEERGHERDHSYSASLLGRSLCALGRHDEAEPLAQFGRERGNEQDVDAQALWRQVQALIHAHRGQHAEAEALAREAVAIIGRTDGLSFQGDALCDLAEVLHAAGRTDEATTTLEQALDRYERKKNLAMVAQVRDRLVAVTT
jgi:hypothetical protein